MRLRTRHGILFLVLVGALNVGRIRVVGVQPAHAGLLEPPKPFARGQELARFEMGSTVVLLVPRDLAAPIEGLVEGQHVRLGTPIGRWRT